jgi:hypothetical protein
VPQWFWQQASVRLRREITLQPDGDNVSRVQAEPCEPRAVSEQTLRLHRLRELRGNGPASAVLSMCQMPPDALFQCGLRWHFVFFMPGFVKFRRFHIRFLGQHQDYCLME